MIPLKLSVSILIGLVGLYAALALGMWALQDRLIFVPPAVTRAQLSALAGPAGAEEVEIQTEDGLTLYGWRLRAGGERAVLYFSGNGGTVGGSPALFEALRGAGFDVLHVNYRGYPGSEGRPSEAGLRADARAAWSALTAEIPPDRIAIMGRSMGGGVAVGLASEVAPPLLILIATFHSLSEVAQLHYPWLPVRRLLRTRFDSGALAGQIQAPVLILHGDADALIPTSQAEALAARFPNGAELRRISGAGHNDPLTDHPQIMAALLQTLEQIPADVPRP